MTAGGDSSLRFGMTGKGFGMTRRSVGITGSWEKGVDLMRAGGLGFGVETGGIH